MSAGDFSSLGVDGLLEWVESSQVQAVWPQELLLERVSVAVKEFGQETELDGLPGVDQPRGGRYLAIVGEGGQKHWKLVPRSEVPEDSEVIPSVWSMRRKRDITTNAITNTASLLRSNNQGSVSIEALPRGRVLTAVGLTRHISPRHGVHRGNHDSVCHRPRYPLIRSGYASIGLR